MPRIAYLYSRYPVVSQTFCDSEMLALEGMGFDLEVVSLNAPPDSFRHERLDRLKAEIHYPSSEEALEAKAKEPAFAEKLGPLIAEHEAKYGPSFKSYVRARNAWHFAPILKKLGVQHVHVHFANRATHTALFLKKLGFTFSFTAHAQDFMIDLGSDDLLREMVREAEFTVAVSDFSRELLAKVCPENSAKIHRIYNGIELNDFPVAEPARGGKLRLVSVGRLIEFKGFHWLIQAVALLKARGLEIEARIIGEGPMREELEQQIMKAGLTPEVQLLGVRSQEQIKRELAAANLFVLPSIVDRKGASDILPTVITEAMACRLPVVSTTLAGIPEMVAHGETGLLVEPGDAEAMAMAIAQLAADPAQHKALGEAGRKRAESLFALAVTAGELGNRFRSALGAAPYSVRLEPPVVYYFGDGNSPELNREDLPKDERLRLLTARSTVSLSSLEMLPDAAVIESLWLRRSAWRFQLEKLRGLIGDALTGEEFYRQARHAVYLADVLPRRGVKHVHAYRSDAVVCVWMIKKLIGLSISAAIEEAPQLSRKALAKIVPELDLFCVADEKLAQMACCALEQCSSLKKPTLHRVLRLGPLRVKLRAAPPLGDGRTWEQDWFQKILQSLHV